MPTATTKQRPKGAAPAENLQARYKPIGLRAVVAATQCRTDAEKAKKEPRKRDLPAVLHTFDD